MPSFTTVHLWCRTPTRPVVLDADATRDGRRDARTITRSRRAMEIIPPHRSRVADATKRRRRRRVEDGRPSLLTRPRRWRHERRQRRGRRRGKRAVPPSAVPPSARSSDTRRVFSSFVLFVIVVRLPRSPSARCFSFASRRTLFLARFTQPSPSVSSASRRRPVDGFRVASSRVGRRRVEYFLIVHVPRRRSRSVARVLRVTRARTEFVAQTRRAPRSVGAFVRSFGRSFGRNSSLCTCITYIDLKGTIICALTLGLLYSRVYYLSIVG